MGIKIEFGDDEPKEECVPPHCRHVDEMHRRYKLAMKLMAIAIVAALGAVAKDVGSLIHVNIGGEAGRLPTSAERTFLDRVSTPENPPPR